MTHASTRLTLVAALSLVLSSFVPEVAAAAGDYSYTTTTGGFTVRVTVKSLASNPEAAGESCDGFPPDVPSELVFDEGFEDFSSLPDDGWVWINRSEPPGPSEWMQGDPEIFPTTEGSPSSYIASSVFACCENGQSGTISNWLLSPPLTFTVGTHAEFRTRTIFKSGRPERLEIRYSAAGASTDVGTGAESVGDFEHLLHVINPNLLPDVYPWAWTLIQVDVVGEPPAVGVGRLALRHFVTDAGIPGFPGTNGLYIGVDSVCALVPRPPVIGVEPESLSSTLPQGTTDGQSLTLANTGGQALDWEIDEEPLLRFGAVEEPADLISAAAAVIDPQGEFVYLGADSLTDDFSYIAKIGLDPFEHEALLELPSGVEGIESAVIDPLGEFAYFGISTNPAQVVKIDLATFQQAGTIVLQPGQVELESAVIDPQGEFAYFGTSTSPGQVVKIALDPFAHVDTLTLSQGMDFPMAAGIDPDGQFAYFGAFVGGAPGVVKIDLGSFQSVDADILEGVVGLPRTVVIDPAGDFAYVGMHDASLWQVVQFDLGTFEEVDSIAGNQEAFLTSAVMDPLGEFAYFGTSSSPSRILRVRLDPFELVEALTMDTGDGGLASAVVDLAGRFAYFGTALSPARAVKVALSMPECTLPTWLSFDAVDGTVPPAGGEQTVGVTFDATGLELGEHTASICFASNDPATPVVQVPAALTVTPVVEFVPASLAFGEIPVGTTSSPMTALLHNGGAGVLENLGFSLDGTGFTMDTTACGDSLPPGGSCAVNVSFIPTAPEPATAVLSAHGGGVTAAQLELSGSGVAPPAVIALDPESLSATLHSGTTAFRPLTVANLGGQTLDWQVTSDVEIFDRVGGIELNDGERDILSAVIDPAGSYAYFGTNTTPGRVIKVDLETFRQVDAIFLESGENGLLSAVIDPAGQFAYFGTDTAPGRVVKIDLATFQRVGAITLEAGVNGLWSAVIDPDGTHAYFGTNTNPGRVARIDLASFVPDGVVTLGGSESFLRSAVIDPAGAFAYFGTDTFPGRVIKINLDPFARVDAITGAAGEDNLVAAVIDPAGTFAYFGTDTDPARVVKINLANFSHFGTLPLAQGENQLSAAVIDPDGEFAYFGTQTDPGRVVKLDLDPFARVGAITLNDDENDLWRAVIDPAGEHAYFATRNDPGRVVKVGLNRPDCTLPTWLSLDPATGSVPGGDEQATTATFDAADLEPGDYSTNLCLASNDLATPLVAVTASMTVTPPFLPELNFDPPVLAFGDVEVGTSPMLTATLANTGDTAATVLDFSAPGIGFAADASDCGESLLADDSCTVVITFSPTVPGQVNAVLEVGSFEGVSASLALAGRGVSKTEVFAPVALEVDYRALLGSDGNRVFEPGEIVDVAPAWRHDGLFEQSLSGAASAFTGPAGPSYDIVAGEATYGLVQPAAIASCRETEVCYQMGIGPEGVPRPALHWDAGFAETVSDASSSTWTLHVGGSFTDVPPTGLFYPFVEAVLHHGVTGGCGDSRYCPLRLTSRRHVAVLALRALEGAGYTPPPCEADAQVFADVPFDSPFCPWIEELFRRGGTAGCGGGSFCPGEALTRGQTAVVLLKTLEGPDYAPGACEGLFADVDCSSPFAAWIEDLYERGVTGGCDGEPLTYCPAQSVNRQQIAVFLARTFGLTLYGP